MKRPDVLRDSESFYIDTPGGRVRSDEVGGIEAYLDHLEQRVPGSATEFLAAWREGVVLAGERFFHIDSGTPDAATDRQELRPNLEMIQASLGAVSPSECNFPSVHVPVLQYSDCRGLPERKKLDLARTTH